MMERLLGRSLGGLHASDLGEAEKLAGVTKSQGAWSRSVLNVSTAHRRLAYRQFLLQQAIYWIAVFGVAIAESRAPRLSEGAFSTWLAGSFANWLMRLALFLPVYLSPPAAVAGSKVLKALPLVIISIACAFWIWSMQLFVGPDLSVRELMLCIGFFGISISIAAMWPVSKITVIGYNAVLWLAFSISLYRQASVDISVLVALNATVLSILWLYVVLTINQVGDLLDRSDQVDLLAKRLHESNLNLEVLKNAAHNALETRSQFFAEASHDLRQQLYAAKLMLLAAGSAVSSGGDAKGAMDRLGNVVNFLEVYMNKVLDFARIESHDFSIHRAPLALKNLFQDMDLQFEQVARSKGVELLFRPTKGAAIATDSALLGRMLQNLIANALQFTRGYVLVCARRRRSGLVIEVWDQGPGIDDAAQARIFEAFYRGEQGKRGKPEGLGLGLAIVKRFADRLGYSVKVRSIVGRGTVFRIHIAPEDVMS